MDGDRKELLDVRNPEIRVDEIMQRIQEKVRLARAARAPEIDAPPPSSADLAGWPQFPYQEPIGFSKRNAS